MKFGLFLFLAAFALSLVGCNPLGQGSGSTIGSGYRPGLVPHAFTLDIPFDQGTDSSYAFNNSSRVELKGGVVSLKSGQTDSDGTVAGFGGGTMVGAQWDSGGYLRLNGSTNTAELDASWAPQWSNIVAYWKFNEAPGAANAADSSPGGANPASGFNYTFGSPGKLNNSAAFNGVNSYLSTPAINLGSAFTISAWAYINVGASNIQTIIGNTGGGAGNGFKIDVDTFNTSDKKLALETGNGVTETSATTAVGAFNFGAWNHVAIVVDKTAGLASIYLNGKDITSASAIRTDFATNAPLTIGCMSNFSWFWNGNLDEVAIWTTKLTASQIQTIYGRQSAKYAGQFTSRVMDAYNAGVAWTSLAWSSTLPFFKELTGSSGNESNANYSSVSNGLMTGIASLWHFDEPGGNTAADSSGNGNTGTIVGGVTPGVAGRLGSGFQFDGINGLVYTSNLISNPQVFTLQAWINTRSVGGLVLGFGDVQAGGSSNYDRHINLDGNGHVVFGITAWPTGNLTEVVSPSTYNDGQWHHIVASFSGAGMALYIDGLLVGSDTTVTKAQIYNGYWHMGYDNLVGWPAGGPNNYFTGSMDEVAVWNRSLSAAEVLQLYRRGANRLKYQIRACTASDCSDQSGLNGQGWLGPDGTNQTYFSELYNTTNNVLGGTTAAGSPSMTFGNFAGSGLSVPNSRYFQYRAILESDDLSNQCNYGAGAVACSPELRSVSIGPNHYDTTIPTVTSNVSVGSSYLTLSSFTETLGANGCSSGARYALSPDGASFYYWNPGSNSWALSVGTYATASSGTDLSSNISAFPGTAGIGTLQVRTFLKSNGTSPCEVDDLRFVGQKY